MRTLVLEQNDPNVEFLLEDTRRSGWTKYDGNRYMYDTVGDKVVIRDVTVHMERQSELIKLSI